MGSPLVGCGSSPCTDGLGWREAIIRIYRPWRIARAPLKPPVSPLGNLVTPVWPSWLLVTPGLHLISTVFIEMFMLLVAYDVENLQSVQYFMFFLCPCSITAAGHCFSYFQSLVMSLFRPVTCKSVSGSYMNLQIIWWIRHVWGLKSSGMWCCVLGTGRPLTVSCPRKCKSSTTLLGEPHIMEEICDL